MCVGRRKRKIRICPHASGASYRELRFPQNHRLLALAEVTRPQRLRPQQRESNQECEPLEPRWRRSRTSEAGCTGREPRSTPDGRAGAGPCVPIDKEAGAAGAPGRGWKGRGPGARPALGPALTRPRTRPSRAAGSLWGGHWGRGNCTARVAAS